MSINEKCIDLREDKSISIQPIGILGIEGHALVEENMGRRSQSHGCAGMAGIGLEGGIDLCNEDTISVKASPGTINKLECRSLKVLVDDAPKLSRRGRKNSRPRDGWC
jgi:hypothetical protein